MRKYLGFLASFLIYLFSPISSVVFADATPTPTPLATIRVCPTGGTTFGSLCITADQIGSLLGNAFNLAALLATLVAVGYLIYGGIKWIMSKGDKTEVESARNHIVAAIIGLIIVFVAFLLINVILQIFGVKTGTSGLIINPIVPSTSPTPT